MASFVLFVSFVNMIRYSQPLYRGKTTRLPTWSPSGATRPTTALWIYSSTNRIWAIIWPTGSVGLDDEADENHEGSESQTGRKTGNTWTWATLIATPYPFTPPNRHAGSTRSLRPDCPATMIHAGRRGRTGAGRMLLVSRRSLHHVPVAAVSTRALMLVAALGAQHL